MSIINYAQKEISFKIVYYGTGVAGKTANLQYIYRGLPDVNRGNMVSLATGDDRTLFIVFVADSQWDRLPENVESFRNLEENLKEYGYNLDEIPYVIQYNKRDLPNVAPVEYLEYLLNRRGRRVPYFESVAVEGKGVFDTLNTVSRMVLVAGFGQEQGALNESK